MGEGRLAADHLEQCTEKWAKSLGDEDEVTIDAVQQLSHAYSLLRQCAEALGLRKQVMEKRQRSLGRDHPHTLIAINGVAISYSDLEREKRPYLYKRRCWRNEENRWVMTIPKL